MRALELNGKKFNKLLVIRETGRGIELKWVCKCDCGNTKVVRGSDLKRGFVKSCGCWNSQVVTKRNTTHNLSKTRFYRIWQAMKDRCLNPNNYRYKYYGSRGITIDIKWLEFENFKKDMYKSYQEHCKKFGIKNTSIDRVDNNGNYKLSNCRWATQKEQINNSRKCLKK